MPIYEFKCNKCDRIAEKLMSMGDLNSKTVICKICKSDMTKLISKSSHILKGDGFYRNEYGYGKKKIEVKKEDGGEGTKNEFKSDDSGD